jgi:hypothetical protein
MAPGLIVRYKKAYEIKVRQAAKIIGDTID